MKTFDYIEKQKTSESDFISYFNHIYENANYLFFDIETTGFSAENTVLYLIGVLWFENDEIHIKQWFNEDGRDESAMIFEFVSFASRFTHLVHFNGLGFDLPYLKKKAEMFSLPFSLDKSLSQIDIYREIRPYKNVLGLEDLKQCTIEKYLGINREDIYSGKELIHTYQRYVGGQEQKYLDLLLLHNHDDVLGMPQISCILNCKGLFEHNDNIDKSCPASVQNEETHLVISYHLADWCHLNKRISYEKNDIYISACADEAVLRIPIYKRTLKHFFEDYKNYYYLPFEDIAIHKDVAMYVDKENRIKATKKSCYTKKEDYYIPCFDKNYPESFKEEYDSHDIYMPLNRILNGQDETLFSYISSTAQSMV